MVTSVSAVPSPIVMFIPNKEVIGPPSAVVPSCVCPVEAAKAFTTALSSAFNGADLTTSSAWISEVFVLV